MPFAFVRKPAIAAIKRQIQREGNKQQKTLPLTLECFRCYETQLKWRRSDLLHDRCASSNSVILGGEETVEGFGVWQ